MVASITNRVKGVTRLRSRDTTLGMPYVVAEEMAQRHQRVNGRCQLGSVAQGSQHSCLPLVDGPSQQSSSECS